MNWSDLTEFSQLDQLITESNQNPVLIFKHSRSCSISRAVLARLERNWELNGNVKTYFLDLLAHRQVSNAIAEKFNVRHESPQALIIERGQCVYDSSHFDINHKEIKSRLQQVADNRS